MSGIFAPKRVLVTIGLAVSLLAAGCGSSNDSENANDNGNETASTQVGKGLPANTAGAIPTLPKEIQPYYKGLTSKLGPSPLGSFKSKAEPPFTLGYASVYAGNSWRETIVDHLNNVLLPEYKKLGLIDEVLITESDLDIPTQIQNQKQLMDRGADGLITIAPPPGLEQSVKYASDRGVPFLSFDGGVAAPEALLTGVNYFLAGYQEAQGLATQIGGEGDVVLVNGIEGTEGSDDFEKGAERALEEFPGINVVGTINGQWTLAVAKAEMLKFLGTHPEPLDGVIAQAGTETGVLQALKQTGRDIPPITIGGEIGPMCYWKNNPDWLKQGYQMWPPKAEVDLAVRVMLRTLLGQGPKIETIPRPQSTLTYDEMVKLLPSEDCSEDDINWLPLDGQDWMPDETLDGFFKNPFPLEDWESRIGG